MVERRGLGVYRRFGKREEVMRFRSMYVGAVVLLVAGLGCTKQSQVSQTIDPARLQMFSPLPKEMPGQAGAPAEQQVSLGRMLYYETRLSKDQRISCNTCHDLEKYGVDGEPLRTATRDRRAHGIHRRSTTRPDT